MDSLPVLFLPIIEWEFRRQRPQQLARCFSRSGDRVYYPFLRLREDRPAPELVESGIWRIGLAGNPGLDPYRDRLPAADVESALASLRELSAEHPLDGCWVIAQLPFWRPLAERVRETFGGALLFDCMDDFSSFGDHGDLGDEESALARAADLVTVTAQALHDKLAPHNPRCVIVRNGCDPEHFGPGFARRLTQRPSTSRFVAGFFGGIHDWFDVPLVEGIARLRPDWQIWLVGDTYRCEVEPLRALANVTFFGEVPYTELPRVASFFDVGLIPFRRTPLTEATNPVKVYEMLAAGLPVVAVDLPELRSLLPLVALASSPEEFVAKIEEIRREPPELRARRREAALRCSWVERFLALRRAMDETAVPLRPSASAGGAPTLKSLGVADFEGRRQALLQELQGAVDALVPQVADLEGQRLSLLEQRDRVQAEAGRLGAELARVEGERLRLERQLHQLGSSRWLRLGVRLGLLRSAPGT